MAEKIYNCYSAGPGLFPRTIKTSEGTRRETWDEAERRVRALNDTINEIPEFNTITPTNTDLADYPEDQQARICLHKDLWLARNCEITFADVTPFGGREPDSGTVVEAVTAALSGNLLVLWADPLTTYAEKFADADVHPDSPLDLHYNLMLEQLYYWSWETHFGFSRPVFGSLHEAVEVTADQIDEHGLKRLPLMERIDDASNAPAAIRAMRELLIRGSDE